MALQINADVQTTDGFTVRPFVFLDIQLYNGVSRGILTYYKDQTSYGEGKSPVHTSLPMMVSLELTSEDFFGPNLAMLFHDEAIKAIEETTGPGTVVVMQ